MNDTYFETTRILSSAVDILDLKARPGTPTTYAKSDSTRSSYSDEELPFTSPLSVSTIPKVVGLPLLRKSSSVEEFAQHTRKVTVIGTGYVGLPLAVLMKDCGHAVKGFDLNQERVRLHKEGTSTIDDVDDEMLEGLEFTSDPSDIKDSDVYVICVPTPVTEQKLPDLSIVKAVKNTLKEYARPGSLIVLESTVGVGDTRRTFADMCDLGYHVAHSPERIDPARKFPALQDIPKVVGGVNDKSTQEAVKFYDTVFTEVVPVRNSDHSEAVKLLENSYRAVNISFINEFANFCESSNLNVNDIIDGASSKPFGFSPFRSWIGVGGHCIPVDPHYLIQCSPRPEADWPILSNVMKSMHERPGMLAEQRLRRSSTKHNRVLVCGVSYKPNVSDSRDAPQEGFIRKLQQNDATVDYYDPLVDSFHGLTKVQELSESIVGSYDHIYVMHMHKVCRVELEALRGRPNVEFFC